MKLLLDRVKSTPETQIFSVHEGGRKIGTIQGEGRNPNQKNRTWMATSHDGKVLGSTFGLPEDVAGILFRAVVAG